MAAQCRPDRALARLDSSARNCAQTLVPRKTSACAQDVHNMDVAKPAALGLIRRGSARAMAAQCRPGRALARPDSSRAYGVEQATVPASQPAEIRRYLGMFVLGWEWINCNYRSGFFRKLVQ